MVFLGSTLLWYQIIAHFGISIGLHRYFSHRQFKMPLLFEWVVLYLCVIAGARSPIGWIAAHRMHHADSDGAGDPHSPKFIGFWNVLFSRWSISTIPTRHARDLFQNKALLFFHKYWLWVWVISALAAPLVSWQFFAGFIVIPGVLSYIGFGLINSTCHRHGTESNTPLINILVAGEGFHKRHHEDGGKIRLDRFDSSGFIIECLLKLGVTKR